MGIESPRGFRGSRAGVQTNLRKIVAEVWFHEGANFRIERPAGGPQCLVDSGRNRDPAYRRPGTKALHSQAVGFVLAFGAVAAVRALALHGNGGSRRGEGRCRRRFGHAEDGGGGRVGLVFQGIVDGADLQFRLQPWRGGGKPTQRCLVAWARDSG